MAMALAASASSTTSLSAGAALSQKRLPSPVNCSSTVRLPLSFYRTRLVSASLPAWQRRSFFVPKAAETETAEEVDKENDADDSGSDYESSDDENGGASSDESVITVESLLQKYKDAISNDDKTTIGDIETKLQSLEKEKESYAKQVNSVAEEVATIKERYIRLNADFDNFRKRSERERLAVSANVKADVVNSLLPMVDNFERAKTQIKVETEGEQKIDSSYQGIYKQFVEIMKGLGVSAVETVGKEFDPNVHDAIMREESSQYAEGVVVEEFRRGFLLGDKLLRPAMVKVSAGPGPATPAAPQESTESEQVPEEGEKSEE